MRICPQAVELEVLVGRRQGSGDVREVGRRSRKMVHELPFSDTSCIGLNSGSGKFETGIKHKTIQFYAFTNF